MKDAGDATVERLIYEDWRHYWESKTRGVLSPSDFESAIRDLSQNYYQNGWLRKKEIIASIATKDEHMHFEDLRTRGIFIEKSVAPGKFKIEPERLALGIGLLLAEEVVDVWNDVESIDLSTAWMTLRDIIETRIEPGKDMSIKAKFCGFAVMHLIARYENDFEIPLACLISIWFQNHNLDELQARRTVMAHLPIVPEVYATVIDNLGRLGRVDALLIEIYQQAIERQEDRRDITRALDPWIFRWTTGLEGIEWDEIGSLFYCRGVSEGYAHFSDELAQTPSPLRPLDMSLAEAAEKITYSLERKLLYFACIGLSLLYGNKNLHNAEKLIQWLRQVDDVAPGKLKKIAEDCVSKGGPAFSQAALIVALSLDREDCYEITLSINDKYIGYWYYNMLDSMFPK